MTKPINDGTWQYTWQHGRQLAQMSKTGETVSCLYNADRLQIQNAKMSVDTAYQSAMENNATGHMLLCLFAFAVLDGSLAHLAAHLEYLLYIDRNVQIISVCFS